MNDFVAQVDKGHDIVVLCDALEITPQLFGPRVEFLPIWIGRPRELVRMGWNITSTPGVSVFEPGATDVVVLLVNDEFAVGNVFLQLVSEQDSRCAAPDDDHTQFTRLFKKCLRDTIWRGIFDLSHDERLI